MNRARRAACSLAIAALLAPAGCGGDEDQADERGGPLSAAEYRAQGNALCRDVSVKVGRVPPPRSPDQIADYVERVLDLGTSYNDDFEALEPPNELRSAHEEAVRLNAESKQQTDALVRRVRASENPAAAVQREFSRLVRGDTFKRSLRAIRRLGLDECLELGQPPEQPSPS